MRGVTAALYLSAYVLVSSLKPLQEHPTCRSMGLKGYIMFTIESYREVLSEHGHRGHIIASAWVIVAALAAVIILFA